MLTIYVYDNEMIEHDDINESPNALIDVRSGFAVNADAEAWFDANYNSNDYTFSYSM